MTLLRDHRRSARLEFGATNFEANISIFDGGSASAISKRRGDNGSPCLTPLREFYWCFAAERSTDLGFWSPTPVLQPTLWFLHQRRALMIPMWVTESKKFSDPERDVRECHCFLTRFGSL